MMNFMKSVNYKTSEDSFFGLFMNVVLGLVTLMLLDQFCKPIEYRQVSQIIIGNLRKQTKSFEEQRIQEEILTNIAKKSFKGDF